MAHRRKSPDIKSLLKEPEEMAIWEEIELLPRETSITHCVLKNSVDLLAHSLNDEANKELAATLLDQRNDEGRTPLELCSILGRGEILKVLLKHGLDINLPNCKGYTSAHYAAAWGQTHILKLLIEANADLSLKNFIGDTPRLIALRYGHMECVDFIDWIVAKTSLETTIKRMQERLSESEKRPNKEEKNLVINTCNEKLAWIESVSMPTTQDFIVQQELLENTLNPIFAKLNPEIK